MVRALTHTPQAVFRDSDLGEAGGGVEEGPSTTPTSDQVVSIGVLFLDRPCQNSAEHRGVRGTLGPLS